MNDIELNNLIEYEQQEADNMYDTLYPEDNYIDHTQQIELDNSGWQD